MLGKIDTFPNRVLQLVMYLYQQMNQTKRNVITTMFGGQLMLNLCRTFCCVYIQENIEKKKQGISHLAFVKIAK